ncbi:U3 small nucleolar RNA-associated protein 6 [Paragonimus westermani]|uniref:U3 small nucleolar RNA-associated protein 6 n=1 Tax=Paragonimus westermani TaxID=34504 RepID=A0A5J4NGL4_9TREM|nr:U3 small nucleolar RNA-associated protein 6 [Paragonimus westermani]
MENVPPNEMVNVSCGLKIGPNTPENQLSTHQSYKTKLNRQHLFYRFQSVPFIFSEIIRKRRQHEYALQRRNKRVLDYDAYIATELAILKLIRIRRQKADDRRFTDKIEKSVISRLVRLHRQLCYRFQSRIDVWIRFVEMCKILGRHMSVVRLWNRILQVHGRTDPRLWAAAASYHLHENANAKIRSSLRNMSGEADKLAEQQKKLRRELKALTRFVEEKNKNTIASIVEELRQNTEKLNQASDELARDRRLLWDRIYLDAIREARRLLTEGISLNPDCKLLQLELVKLEAAAADFFSTRITDRWDPIKEDNRPTTESMDISGNPVPAGVKNKKRKRYVAKTVEDDNTQFMANVTEDVLFVASGKALKLVIESLLEQSPNDVKTLESLQLVASTVPHLVEDSLMVKLNEVVYDNFPHQFAVDDFLHIGAAGLSEAPILKQDEQRSCLIGRTVQLCQTVLCDGLPAALELWDSWFTGTEQGVVKRDRFRYLNPQMPEAVGLLRTRLLLHSLQSSWLKIDLSDEQVVMKQPARSHPENEELQRKTRAWLDTLATSNWGQQSAEFWFYYSCFERDFGDCTRLPAVQWRASKTLEPEAYNRFTSLLNTNS